MKVMNENVVFQANLTFIHIHPPPPHLQLTTPPSVTVELFMTYKAKLLIALTQTNTQQPVLILDQSMTC